MNIKIHEEIGKTLNSIAESDQKPVDDVANEILMLLLYPEVAQRQLESDEFNALPHLTAAGIAQEAITALESSIVFLKAKVAQFESVKEKYEAGLENSRALEEALQKKKVSA